MQENKSNIKISIIAPNLTGGGAEKIAVSLANHYSALGFSIDLVLFQARGEYIQQISEFVNIIDLKIKHMRLIFGLPAMISLRSYFKNNRPNVVLSVLRPSNIVVGLAVFKLSLNRVVFREANTLHGLLAMPWYRRTLNKWIMKMAYKNADVVIANSNDTKNDLINKSIVNSYKPTVIPNPVLRSNYLELSDEHLDDEFIKHHKTIISIGRLHVQKNFPLLIKAFYKVYKNDQETRLLIIGEGEEKSRLLDLINSLKLQDIVRIEGFKQNIYPFIKHSKVFALASSWEGFGNVIVEALAMGKSIVCTNCPGGPKYILDNGKYGKLVPVDNVELFAEAILESLNNPVNENILIKRARQFTVEKIAEEYLKELLPRIPV